MEKIIHVKRFKKALKDKKLILIQYSCSDFKKVPMKITSFFALNCFTDEEFGVDARDKDFNNKLKKYFQEHQGYYFVLWNYNFNYSFKNFNVFDENELKELDNNSIDLDDVFENYAIKNNQTYIKKIDGGFDTRYYFALLNNIEICGMWLWGGHEKDITNYPILLESSRLKVKITAKLINLYLNKKLKVFTDDLIVKKSKKIIGFSGKILYWKRDIKKIFIYLGLILLGYFGNYIFNFIMDNLFN